MRAAVLVFTSFAVTVAASAQSWTQIVSPMAPAVRGAAALAYDSARGKVILFGGNLSEFVNSNETWEFNGSTWQQLTASPSPAARANHCMAYDAWRHEVILFGGVSFVSPGLFMNDTWRFDGTWHQVPTTTQPSSRFDARMVYDTVRRRVVLFGGFGGGVSLGDTWEFDGTNWQQRMPAPNPPPRSLHGMAYDTARGVTLMYGAPSLGLSDLWEWDGNDWRAIPTTNTPPPRPYYMTTFDPLRGRMLMWSGAPNETWEYDGSTRQWTDLAAPLPISGFIVMSSYGSATFDTRIGSAVTHFLESPILSTPGKSYVFAPPSVASVTPLGAGCAGSAGTPVLSTPPQARPVLGTTLPL